MPHNKKDFFIPLFVLLLIMVGQSAVDTYLPSFPAIVDSLGTTKTQVQMTLFSYFIGIGFSQLLFGPLSDQLGRRPILMAGLTLFIIGSLTCAAARSIEVLLTARLVQGIGAGAPSVLSRVIMRDKFGGKDLFKLASYAIMSWATIPTMAPLLGGFIQETIGWRANFITISCFAGVILISMFFLLPETRSYNHHKQPTTQAKKGLFAPYLTLIRSRVFLGYALCVSICYGVFVAFNAIGPFLLQNNLGLSALEYSKMVVIVCSGFILGSFINSKLSANMDHDKVMLYGFTFFFIFNIGLLLFGLLGILNVYVIVIPLFLIQCSLGLIIPNGMAGCLEPFPHIAGRAGALFGFLFLTGGAITSIVISRFPDPDQVPLALAILLLGMCALGVFSTLIIAPKKKQKT